MASRKRTIRAALLTVAALVALTLTAVPSNATFAKKYDLTVSPSSVASGATGVFSATYKNLSLYKLGSVELTIPPGFQKVSATTSRGTISQTATKVTVKNLNLSLYLHLHDLGDGDGAVRHADRIVGARSGSRRTTSAVR